ncbi:hypothetical protein FQN60_011980, partial [Etheostoma spectabile]
MWPQGSSSSRTAGTVMANIAVQRIKREFKEVLKSEETSKNQIKVDLVDENFTELRGEIAGPPDTPYEGGRYQLEIKIPETYPFNPPKVRFISKIWHPNISSVTGAICLDILKDQWAAAMTLRTVLLSLQALLAAAEPDDPQDAVVANQYKQNPEMFKQTARLWSHVYAGAPISSPDYTRKIDKLCAMGFDKITISGLDSSSISVSPSLPRKRANVPTALPVSSSGSHFLSFSFSVLTNDHLKGKSRHRSSSSSFWWTATSFDGRRFCLGIRVEELSGEELVLGLLVSETVVVLVKILLPGTVHPLTLSKRILFDELSADRNVFEEALPGMGTALLHWVLGTQGEDGEVLQGQHQFDESQ